ncbi:hypothetical protein ACLBXM_17990 [Xanthobacteraceae bacterium A53D]
MATEMERLYVSMEANFARYEKALAKIERQTSGTTLRMQKRVTEMEAGMSSKFGAAVAGIASVTGAATVLGGLSLVGIVGELRAAAEQFATIADIADRTGLGSEQVQELQYAAEMAGGSVEDMNGGLVRFTKGVSDAARGTGDLGKVLEANGVALTDVNGKLKPSIDLFFEYADLIRGAKNPQDALNLATMAFGRSAGPGLVVALQQGAAGLKAAAKEGREFGIVIDDALIRKGAEIDDAFVRLARTIKVQVGSALVEGAEGVQQYQNAIIGLAAAIGAVAAGATLGPLVSSLAMATAGATAAAIRMNVLNTTILAVAAAQRVAALASAGLSTALSLLGGPVGIGITAVVGTIAYLALRTDQAKEAAERHKASLQELDGAIAQVRAGMPGAIERVRELGAAHVESAKKALADAEAQLEYAKAVSTAKLSGYAARYNVGGPQDNTKEVAAAIAEQTKLVEEQQKKLAELQAKMKEAEKLASDPPGGGTIVPDPGADAKGQQLDRILEQTRQRTEMMNLERQLLGQTTYEIDRQRTQQELLNSVKMADIELTPQLEERIRSLSEAHASSTVALENATLAQERWIDLQQEVGSYMVDSISSLTSGYRNLNDVLKDGINLLAQMALKAALLNQGPFASGSGSGLVGALFGGVKSLFGGGGTGFNDSTWGFDKGGYTGNGGRYAPAGLVHRGEYVFDQDAVKGAGGPKALDALRRGLRGYASGGYVGVPNVPSLAGMGGRGRGATFNTTINAPGSQLTEEQLHAIIDMRDRRILAKVPSLAVQGVLEGRRNVAGLR